MKAEGKFMNATQRKALQKQAAVREQLLARAAAAGVTVPGGLQVVRHAH